MNQKDGKDRCYLPAAAAAAADHRKQNHRLTGSNIFCSSPVLLSSS
jgi:hypothetical protein